MKFYIRVFFLLFNSCFIYAQVGIGTASPASSSAFEISSTSKGFLPPRMTQTQMNAIVSPATGLHVDCLDCAPDGLYRFNGTIWKQVGAAVTTPVITSVCNGFVTGSYINGIVTSGTYTVTLTNNSFSTATIAFQNSDLVLSGVSGLSVTGTSPANISLIPGSSSLVTYTVTGTPTAIGTLTGTWTKLSLICAATKAVTLGDANFTLPPAAFVVSALDGSPLVDIQGVVDNSANKKTVSLAYTGGQGSYAAFTSAWVPAGSGMGQSGDSNNFRVSYPAGTFSSTGNIVVTYEVDGDQSFNAKKKLFSTQETIATLPLSVNGVSKGYLLLDVIGVIPDRRFGQTSTQNGIVGMYHNNVYSPITSKTGKVWLNNNLGSDYSNMSKSGYSPLRQGNSSTDYLAYGSLYQWGRLSDGHELINWTSSTTGTPVNGTTFALSGTDIPVNNLYILNGGGIFDWRSPQNNSLWQGVSGVNNPCPQGYRVPTFMEFVNENTAYGIVNSSTGYNSIHKFVGAGFRNDSSGSIGNISSVGEYSASDVSGGNRYWLSYRVNAVDLGTISRGHAFAVRCIKQ